MRWKYLALLPRSNVHHHQSENLLQYQDRGQMRGPGDHPYHQMDNHHHALEIKPMLNQQALCIITLLMNRLYPDFYNI